LLREVELGVRVLIGRYFLWKVLEGMSNMVILLILTFSYKWSVEVRRES